MKNKVCFFFFFLLLKSNCGNAELLAASRVMGWKDTGSGRAREGLSSCSGASRSALESVLVHACQLLAS